MTTIKLRPRFQLITAWQPDDVIEIISKKLKDEAAPVNGKIVDNHIILKIPPEKRHYWSPQLDIELEKTEEGTEVRGLLGPSPSVWTKFMFIYSGLGFVGMIGLMLGISQLTLSKSPTGLWIFFITLGGIVVAYFSGQTGKGLARDEMLMLRKFLFDALNHAE